MNILNAFVVHQLLFQKSHRMLGVREMGFEDPIFMIQQVLMYSNYIHSLPPEKNLFDDFQQLPMNLMQMIRQHGKPQLFVESASIESGLKCYVYLNDHQQHVLYKDLYLFSHGHFLMKTILMESTQPHMLTDHFSTILKNLAINYGIPDESLLNPIAIQDLHHHRLFALQHQFYAIICLLNGDPKVLGRVLHRWMQLEIKSKEK